MASKKMPRKKPAAATADKVENPWTAHGFKGDKAPFAGAGPPIHTRDGGKYHPSNKNKSSKKKAGK
jgi:hypothetical protein